MVRVGLAGPFVVLVCSSATAYGASSFAEPLRLASAEVPLTLSQRIATRILPGDYDGKLPGLVRIDANRAFFCKGPDYSKGCVALTAVDGARTMAVNDPTGRTVLLEYNNSTFSRICTVNAAGFRPTLDCRVVESSRLAEYGVRPGANWSLLMVDAVDGKYVCADPSGFRQCSRILDKAGRPIPKPKN